MVTNVIGRLAVVLAALALGGCGTLNFFSRNEPIRETHQVLLDRPPPPVKLPTAPPLYVVGIEKFYLTDKPEDRLVYRPCDEAGRCAPYDAPSVPKDCEPSRELCVDLQRLAATPAWPSAKAWGNMKRTRAPEHQLAARAYDNVPRLKRLQEGDTQMGLGHVVELRGDGACAAVLFSAFGDPTCGRDRVTPERSGLVQNGWSFLTRDDRFQKTLRERIDRDGITHIIVMSTGWRTPQFSSLGYYEKWANGIVAASDPATFKPLFIGLTWPAARSDIQFINARHKAHDADEAGVTWGNVFVNRTLADVSRATGVKVVLIGHSYGARLLSTAALSAPAVGGSCAGDGAPRLLVGLQAAFSTSRFVGLRFFGRDAWAFNHFAECRTQLVYTSSREDWQVNIAPSQIAPINGTAYMGSGRVAGIAGKHSNVLVWGSDEKPAAWPARASAVLVLDATPWITGHSDVQGCRVGQSIAKLIHHYADAKAGPAVDCGAQTRAAAP